MPTSATFPASSATMTDVSIDHPDVYICYVRVEQAVHVFAENRDFTSLDCRIRTFVDLTSDSFRLECESFLSRVATRRLKKSTPICEHKDCRVSVAFAPQDDGTWLMTIMRPWYQ